MPQKLKAKIIKALKDNNLVQAVIREECNKDTEFPVVEIGDFSEIKTSIGTQKTLVAVVFTVKVWTSDLDRKTNTALLGRVNKTIGVLDLTSKEHLEPELNVEHIATRKIIAGNKFVYCGFCVYSLAFIKKTREKRLQQIMKVFNNG